MKRLLLSALLISTSLIVKAQSPVVCDTDLMSNNASTPFGAWPSTQDNLGPATVGLPYEQMLHFKVPTSAGDINPSFNGATINHFTVTAVEGIPANFTYSCNITAPTNCRFSGGTWGCARLYNTSEILESQINTTGYDVSIIISANISIPFIGSSDVPYTFEGYKLVINPRLSVNNLSLEVATLFPNPANDIISLDKLDGVLLINFYAVTGELIRSVQPTNETMQINISDFAKGTYMVNVVRENKIHVMKLIKD